MISVLKTCFRGQQQVGDSESHTLKQNDGQLVFLVMGQRKAAVRTKQMFAVDACLQDCGL